MLYKILSILRLRKEINETRTDAIEKARKAREEAGKKIDGIVAQINGCGDKWFLQPMKSIDECDDKDLNGGTT